MSSAARNARRKAERDRRKATRQIPPEVRERISQVQRGEKIAPPEPIKVPPVDGADADLPPGIPSDLPKEIADAIHNASAIADSSSTRPKGITKARSKRFVDLEKELAILLTLPGPAFEAGGDTYCASHFMMQGPLLASRLTSYAETNPATAQFLERIVSAGGIAIVAVAIFSYALPPMLHHGLPAPDGLKKMYHVPVKQTEDEDEEVERE